MMYINLTFCFDYSLEREAAVAVYSLVQQSHRLLVTLLLMNALAYECLPLFLDELLPTYLTILFSVSLLLIFGEIIPSAIFTGPDQLVLASKLAPAVSISMTVLSPIVTPLVKLLDWLVPSEEENENYNRAELSALVRIQYEDRMKAEHEQNHDRGGSSLSSPPNNSRPRSKVPHLANQLTAEMQRRKLENDNFGSARSWRHLKEQIMYAVAEKSQQQQQSTETSSLFDNDDQKKSHKRTRSDGSGGFPSLLTRSPSSTSVTSESLPYEQIAPPLERTEIRAVEGALKLKTGCAFDV